MVKGKGKRETKYEEPEEESIEETRQEKRDIQIVVLFLNCSHPCLWCCRFMSHEIFMSHKSRI